MKKTKVAILISGRGSNMQALIEACKVENFPAEIALVISNKENAAGLEIAQKNNIKSIFIDHKNFASRAEFDNKLTNEIEKQGCEIVCLAGFMRILSADFVRYWKGRAINIHPSLLPHFKGADAVGDALKAGVKKSGCTVHFVEQDVDSGQIIVQEEVDILPEDNRQLLAARILEKEHKIYPKALKFVCNNLKL